MEMAFSPDGRLLAATGIHRLPQPRNKEGLGRRGERTTLKMRSDPFDQYPYMSRLWEVASGQEVFHVDARRPFSRRSPSPRTAACWSPPATSETSTSGWDARTGQRLCAFDVPKALEIVTFPTFSPDSKLLATCHGCTVLLWDVRALVPTLPDPPAVAPAAFGGLWEDLASADVAIARRAVWALAAAPGQSVPLLRDRLRPAPLPTTPKLASPPWSPTWTATTSRHASGPAPSCAREFAVPALVRRGALANSPSVEAKRRLRQLLEKPSRPVQDAGRLRTCAGGAGTRRRRRRGTGSSARCRAGPKVRWKPKTPGRLCSASPHPAAANPEAVPPLAAGQGDSPAASAARTTAAVSTRRMRGPRITRPQPTHTCRCGSRAGR